MLFNPVLLKALAALIPVGLLCAGAAIMYVRERTLPSILLLLGAACLVMVVLAHICEALHVLPWMRWGDPDSAGHYLDLASAIVGLTLLLLGYLLRLIACKVLLSRIESRAFRHRFQRRHQA